MVVLSVPIASPWTDSPRKHTSSQSRTESSSLWILVRALVYVCLKYQNLCRLIVDHCFLALHFAMADIFATQLLAAPAH